MMLKDLRKLLETDLAKESEKIANLAINYNPRFKWDYKSEAEDYLAFLSKLEALGYIKILK